MNPITVKIIATSAIVLGLGTLAAAYYLEKLRRKAKKQLEQ